MTIFTETKTNKPESQNVSLVDRPVMVRQRREGAKIGQEQKATTRTIW